MPITVEHTFVDTQPDDGSGLIGPNEWNGTGAHTVIGSAGLALIVSDTDPGVGADIAWLRTDPGIPGGAGNYRQLYLPNADASAWIEVGLVHYDADGNRRMAVTTSDVATDITLWDETGALTALVSLGPAKIEFQSASGILDFDLAGASGGSAGHLQLLSADTGGPAGAGTLLIGSAGGFTGSAQFQLAYGEFDPTSDPSFDLGIGTIYMRQNVAVGELWLQLASAPATWGRIGTQAAFVEPTTATPEAIANAMIATGLMAAS